MADTSLSLLVSASEAAELLGLSRSGLYGLLAAGRVPQPVQNLGRRVLWSRAVLEQWVSDGCPVPEAR